MPATLLTAKIRGVRSYSPKETLGQTVDFMPLTLIVGANGTGKTTVIEALKFIISGEEPPHSDSRRNFIHTPKNERCYSSDGAYASIEIQFRNSAGELCTAKREISRASNQKTTPSICSSYKIGLNPWVTVHKQDDWNKILPRLFGLPNQAILSNVILCHQEDNNWCMGESSSVKQVFDRIFGCEQYKKEIRHIDDEIRNSKKDLAMSEKDMQHLGQQVERKKVLASTLGKSETELAKIREETQSLDTEILEKTAQQKAISKEIKELETKSRELSTLKQTENELKERDKLLKKSLQPLLNRRKREAVSVAIQPVKKKPALDPTASDLEFIIKNLSKITLLVNELAPSQQTDSIKDLIRVTTVRVESIYSQFKSPSIDEEQIDKEEQARLQKQLEQEAEYERQDNECRISIENDCKKNLEQLEAVREKIQAIQEQIQSDERLQQTKDELKKVEESLMTLRDRRSRLTGSQYQLEREVSRFKSELKSYDKVSINYAESLGKFVCSQMITKDLEKLKTCFQESITSFHDQMIIKINEVLRARWRQIYQGKDIDYVELVDEEITRGKDKKSYNYYMAMRKNGTRMKMREKSSAGQRALASIILRMTLAELFVRDFAFIAFDEPTANLDLANVQALARSIGQYVRRRTKKGAHIQWIIITHDEQFLRALDEDCSPFFYRTQMDSDGFSQIVKRAYQDADLLSAPSSTVAAYEKL